MADCSLLDIIDKKTHGRFNFLRLKSAVFKKKANVLLMDLLFPDGHILTESERDEIIGLIHEELPTELQVEVSFKKSYFDNQIILDKVKSLVSENFPTLADCACEKTIITDNNHITVVNLAVDSNMKQYATVRNVKEFIETELDNSFCGNFEVLMNYIDFTPTDLGDVEDNDFSPDLIVPTEAERFIEVTDVENFIGKDIDELPRYISDLNENISSTCVCGKVHYLNVKPIKTKKGGDRLLVRFALKDFTGEIHVTCFASASIASKIEKLCEGVELLVRGDIEKSEYIAGLSLKAKDISLCILPKEFDEVVTFKQENKKYNYVFPTEMHNTKQVGLFDSVKENAVPDFMMANDVVVFDFETTGLNFLDSQIIEIGAVKLKKGIICEAFSCFVKPTTQIPPEITALTSITDEDVKKAYPYEKVLQDFFKFTRNSILVAYNINFDYGFLNCYGRKCGYDFSENMRIDALALATKGLRGLPNYKLKTVANHLGVDLTNAHRAIHDAIATAEVFIKLAEFV